MTRKLLFLLIITSPCFAQNVRKDDVALQTITQQTSAGTATYVKPIAGAQIDVCSSTGSGTPCSPHAGICSSETDVVCAQPNPFNADVNGNYGFWVPSGLTYQVSITGLGVNSKIITYTLGPTKPGLRSQVFTSSGTFTIPTSITAVKVTVVAGGGAGGGSNAANTYGVPGGSGGVAIKWLSGLTPGNTLVVTIGTGGSGVVNGTGGTGSGSSVSSGTQSITSIVTNGGLGGLSGQGGINGGALGGALGSGGDLNFPGGIGETTWVNTASASGGTAPLFGSGKAIGVSGSTGNTGGFPGAGGTGSQGAGPFSGGNGGNGVVIFEWVN